MNEIILHMKVGAKIREIRKSKSMSLLDLAVMCNFEKSNMSRIESGRTNLTLNSLYKISLALEVKISDLLDVDV